MLVVNISFVASCGRVLESYIYEKANDSYIKEEGNGCWAHHHFLACV